MSFEEVWADLLSNERILSREEVEYEIAMSDEILAERERLVWKLLDNDSESVRIELKKLYKKVVLDITGRNYD